MRDALDRVEGPIVEVLGQLRVLLHGGVVENGRAVPEAMSVQSEWGSLVRQQHVPSGTDALEDPPGKASFRSDRWELSGDGAIWRSRSKGEDTCISVIIMCSPICAT